MYRSDEAEVKKFRIINDGTGEPLGVIFSTHNDRMHIQSAFDHVFGRGESELRGSYTLQRLEENEWVDTEYKKVCKIKD